MVHAIQLDVEQVSSIRREAERILDHATFKSSERCSKLLSYLLERALEDPGLPLKERQIGQEVFGKAADYDTGTQPIVRNAATETRKRLRQFYSEAPISNGVRIDLSPGSYLLHFTFDNGDALSAPRPVLTATLQEPNGGGNPQSHAPRSTTKTMLYTVTALTVLLSMLCGGVIGYHLRRFDSDLPRAGDRVSETSFWKPIFASKKEIFIAVGHADTAAPGSLQTLPTLQHFTMTDLRAYTTLAGPIEMEARPFQMRSDLTTNLEDMKDRPSILIGNRNNLWVSRLTSELRYRPTYTSAPSVATNGIVDLHNPGAKQWEIVGPSSEQTVNYAIAERFKSPITGDIVVCVAGIGIFGTQAASEILTNADFLETLPKELENPNKGIQIILKIPIVDGVAGRPEVVTTYIW